MLSIEQIENIIKSKYNDLVITSTDCFTRFMFDIKDIASHKEIIFYFNSEDKLYYEKEIWNTEARYQDCNFIIENNAIELKHYLDIKITQQDIIDWLNTILKINEDGEYSIPIPPSFSQVLVEILDDKTIEIKTSLMFKDKKEREEHLILLANNSNDYWKAYNIIKNLKR